MKVLLRLRNRFTISVAINEELQFLLGLALTYPALTHPWSITLYFLMFEFEWVGKWKTSHREWQVQRGISEEDPEWYYDDDA